VPHYFQEGGRDMRLVLQTADVAGAEKNCLYPNRVEVSTPEGLREAVRMDHVCGEYRKDYRSVKNFIRTNVVVMDIDNDHSEDPEDWVTPEKLDEMMGDLSYAIAFSRHHMKDKHGVGPRLRMHVYFETGMITDADEYKALKAGIHKRWDFFDGNALDAARFIYGADVGECIWHEGWLTVDGEVEAVYEEEGTGGGGSGSILQGSRNNTMSRFAVRVLKRYGDTDKAKEAFLEHAEKCDPPLPDKELSTIWHSAQKFYGSVVVKQPDYVPPDKYNEEFGGYLKPEDYTDMDEAKVLVREYGEELKYSPATGYIRYDGQCWIEDEQLAVGAVEEFLDLQIKDAKDEVSSVEKALIQAGIPKEIVMVWTEQDVLEYIYHNHIPIADVYGEVVADYGKGEAQGSSMDLGIFDVGKPVFGTTGCNRTGCVYCGFGCHREKSPNRWELAEKLSNPAIIDYMMRGGAFDEKGIWKPDERGFGFWFVAEWINVHGKLHIVVPHREEYLGRYMTEDTEKYLAA